MPDMARKGKIAEPADVLFDDFGATCRRCKEPLFLAAIRQSRPVYRHVSKTPWREGCRA
jgi:hypothetical protein